MRFVAVGDVLVDVVSADAPGAGRPLHTRVSLRAGGSAVNAAVWAAALGARAEAVGRVGADDAGELVRVTLERLGVRSALARDEHASTGVAVALGSDRSRVVAVDPGASAALSPADISDPLEGDALLVSGFSLLQERSSAAGLRALEAFTGRWRAVDLGSPGLAAAARERLGGLTTRANVLLATAQEARALTGADAEAAAGSLAGDFNVVAIKLGADGALVAHAGGLERRAAEAVPRRSAFGAGDAFAAGLLVSLGGGEAVSAALASACAAGARAAASPTGWPTP